MTVPGVFLRAVGVTLLIAFTSLWTQIHGHRPHPWTHLFGNVVTVPTFLTGIRSRVTLRSTWRRKAKEEKRPTYSSWFLALGTAVGQG